MKRTAWILALLATVGTAYGAEHWRGAGWGGDGTTWGQTENWDDTIPSATTWDANRSGEQGTPGNHNIIITTSGACGAGTIYDQAGYTVNLKVLSGATMTNSGALTYSAAGNFTVGSNAFYDMRYGQLTMGNGNLLVTIEPTGHLYCSSLRHNNGGKLDVSGLLEAWSVNRISAEGTYRFNVYNGGEFKVYTSVPAGQWSNLGKVTQFVGSTVTLAGDHSAPADYLAKVQAGEAGTWQVAYAGGWTKIQLVPEPLSLLLLALGLPLFRRHR